MKKDRQTSGQADGQTDRWTDDSPDHLFWWRGLLGVHFSQLVLRENHQRSLTWPPQDSGPPPKGQAQSLTGWGSGAYLEVGGTSPQESGVREERQVLVAKGDGHVDDDPCLRTQTRRNLG